MLWGCRASQNSRRVPEDHVLHPGSPKKIAERARAGAGPNPHRRARDAVAPCPSRQTLGAVGGRPGGPGGCHRPVCRPESGRSPARGTPARTGCHQRATGNPGRCGPGVHRRRGPPGVPIADRGTPGRTGASTRDPWRPPADPRRSRSRSRHGRAARSELPESSASAPQRLTQTVIRGDVPPPARAGRAPRRAMGRDTLAALEDDAESIESGDGEVNPGDSEVNPMEEPAPSNDWMEMDEQIGPAEPVEPVEPSSRPRRFRPGTRALAGPSPRGPPCPSLKSHLSPRTSARTSRHSRRSSAASVPAAPPGRPPRRPRLRIPPSCACRWRSRAACLPFS